MKLVCYYRVSTVRQGQSGLGLDAQRSSVEGFRRSNDATVIAEFTEVESGKRSTRPEIAKAIALCKSTGATLIVAKLDRLARSVAFTSALMESGVEFLACDNPHANRLTVHILAAISENEAQMISKRTREALAAAKRKGVVLGTPSQGVIAAKGNAANKRAAAEFAATVRPIAQAKRALGWTLQQVGDYLNGRGYRTRYGKPFSTTAVLRLLA